VRPALSKKERAEAKVPSLTTPIYRDAACPTFPDNVVNGRMHQAMTGPGLSRAKPVGFRTRRQYEGSLRLVDSAPFAKAAAICGRD
jgi:hypothetical protein